MSHTAIKNGQSFTNNISALEFLIRQPKVKLVKQKAIILLHGVGGNEEDLFSFSNQLPDDFFVISPRGPFTLAEGRYAWYQVDFSTGKPIINSEQEAYSRSALVDFIREVKREFNVDETYLAGFSQGAIMSYSVGLTHSGEVQGIISLSGRLLEEIKPFVTKDNHFKQSKVFVAHGTQDNTLPVYFAREAKTYLESLGVELTYGEYAIGHQISSEILFDVNRWLG